MGLHTFHGVSRFISGVFECQPDALEVNIALVRDSRSHMMVLRDELGTGGNHYVLVRLILSRILIVPFVGLHATWRIWVCTWHPSARAYRLWSTRLLPHDQMLTPPRQDRLKHALNLAAGACRVWSTSIEHASYTAQ